MEVPQKRWMVYFMENPIFKIDDLGIPLFRETPRIIYLIIAQLPDHHRISSFPAPIWTVPNLVVWHPVEWCHGKSELWRKHGHWLSRSHFFPCHEAVIELPWSTWLGNPRMFPGGFDGKSIEVNGGSSSYVWVPEGKLVTFLFCNWFSWPFFQAIPAIPTLFPLVVSLRSAMLSQCCGSQNSTLRF